ncbi:type I-E CRISPR-associated protein Cse2/CasB [Streptomyces sp. BG9H]|uniref:Type I-E CRISPR-associated protein Cse2/CasB n=1 Tax=Streptomyces anatolicus TaxID=2675858 RepID=A0ABS6YTA3_9ACTN|nr:type I-E CRISPR-associated protein Cse2/CasB [Streptomyces anatolicus]MBW5424305.1 type I-E CRISPR-associated protein Cse2/CasB [Streptomyces anatolicus]
MTNVMPSSPVNTPRQSSGGGLPRPSLQAPGRATDRCIGRLQALYRQDNSSAVAALARLRRGVGKAVHEAPESWGNDGLEELSAIRAERDSVPVAEPEDGVSAKYYSTDQRRWSEQRELAEEKAVFLTITLWALHQQSIRDANMHAHDWGLGRSVRHLAQGRLGTEASHITLSDAELTEKLNEPLRKRFVRIGTSTSLEMLGTRLRTVVLLLRGARIPLDYARLADQLTAWQDIARQAEVRRTWGRDFHLSSRRSSRSEPGPAASGDNGGGSDHLLDAGD